MKVALLYLCSGEYKVLWDDYYKSFMEYFLPDCEKDFYVFTDVDSLPFEEKGNFYVMGSFNGGKTEDYLKMAEILNNNENIDESNHVMAKVFDESHLNYYIARLDEKSVKVLSSAYCSDYREPEEKVIIVMANKADYFDEDAIKQRKGRSFAYVWLDKGIRFINSYLHFIIDSLQKKKISAMPE